MDHVMCLTIYNSYVIATQLLQDITIFKQVSKRNSQPLGLAMGVLRLSVMIYLLHNFVLRNKGLEEYNAMHGFILEQYNLMAVIYTAASVHLLAIDILYPSEHWKAKETQQNNKLA